MRLTVISVVALAVLGAAGCGGTGPSPSAGRSKGSSVPASCSRHYICTPALRQSARTMQHCATGPLGGGYDVWVHGMSCRHLREAKVLRRIGFAPEPRPGHRSAPDVYRAGRQGVFRSEIGGYRWTCWSRNERRYGIHELCFRKGQIVIRYFS
jgi:hypothetical protein